MTGLVAIGRRVVTTLKVLGIFGFGWVLGSAYGSAICANAPAAKAALAQIGVVL
jgi:hypothetical protein